MVFRDWFLRGNQRRMELQGKRILLTGANGGIGSALVRQLAKEGCKLVLCSQQQPPLEKMAGELAASGYAGSVEIMAADLSRSEDRRRVVSQCEALDGIDILINLAGMLDFRLFEDQPEEVVNKLVNLNLLAPMHLCQLLLPQLKTRPEAMILNVGSIFGSIGHPGFVAYCTSKAGMKMFSESLARELADTNVKVAYIAPRATATALNSNKVNDLNLALGNSVDSPDHVAQQIIAQLKSGKILQYLGWPEKLFVRVNALLPSVVHNALVKKLSIIKGFIHS